MINLSQEAIAELKRFKASQSDSGQDVVRIGISGGGCSGFTYNMSFQEESEINAEQDNILEFDEIRVVIDKKSMLYLDGTTVNWVETLTHRGFTFDNPNATRECGCKKSFGVG